MNNDLCRLTVRPLTDFAQVEKLYAERLKKDFARNELRPLANLRRSWEKGAYDCYGLFRGDEILGYAFFVRLGRSYLFDYLAVAEQHRIWRFSPRREGSTYSRPNIERLIWLDAQGLIHPKIRQSVLPVIESPFIFPEDILSALRQDETVWENYQRFSEPYRRIRVAYIDAARARPAEFQKRLKSFIEKTRRNKRIVGYGGIGKYYG